MDDGDVVEIKHHIIGFQFLLVKRFSKEKTIISTKLLCSTFDVDAPAPYDNYAVNIIIICILLLTNNVGLFESRVCIERQFDFDYSHFDRRRSDN